MSKATGLAMMYAHTHRASRDVCSLTLSMWLLRPFP